ncbi:MAG: MobF family relaxase [Leptospirales bacterium]
MALGRNISPGQGETYYRKDDYYLEREGGEDHRLEWGGKLAAELGLEGKAGAEDWKNALNGHFPGGIEIQGGSFKDPETGERERRAGTDYEFSAPKSISIQALVHGDERLIQAHRESVSIAMAVLEKEVGARRGHAGKNWETSGKGLIGRVTHMTSRAGDPQLHDHVVFLNITKNSDGSFQAMTNDRMMNYQRMVQEVYFEEMAHRLESMGFEIESGKYREPEIKGYTREHIEHFSKRLSDVDSYLMEHFGETRKTASPAHKRLAAEHSREAKKAREIEGLQKEWETRAKEIGAEKVIPEKERKLLSSEKRLEIARESLVFAIEHHTERESAVKEGELFRTALQAGRGKVTSRDMEKAVEESKSSGDLIRQAGAGSRQNLMTSREALEREKRILSFEKTGRHVVKPILNPLQAENALKAIQEKEGLTLNDEQKAAARMILTSDNRYSGINGYAGVGKTTMLKPAIEATLEGGYRVIGLGPQHSAVHALKDAGIIEARTLQSWLADRKAGEGLDEKTVVVIDEAGLTNARDLESAMKRIEKAGSRAVLVGDIKQYESVAAGPAFALLQKAGMETVYVTEMQRQNKAAANVKEAARLSIASPEKALEKIEIREIKNAGERYRALSEEYLQSPDKKETLVLTGTHEARKAVNEYVRESLGLSGKGHEFSRYEAGGFTEAQKKRIDAYEIGQAVRFGKEYRDFGVKSGEIGHVEAVDKEKSGTVRLKMEDGRFVSMSPRKLSGKGHEIGKIETLELTSGDRIRITGNELKKEGITNGMRGEIIESNHDSLKIRLDSGKTFDLKPGGRPVEIDHGYAQTGHSAQGLGVQTVILDLPSNSQTLNRRSFYTNLTRTKNQAKAFTDDREKLTGAVTREKDKTMAHDVEKEIREERRKPSEKMREQKTMERPDDLRFGETPEQTKARFGMWKGEKAGIGGLGENKTPGEEKEREQKPVELKKEERKVEKEDKAVTGDGKAQDKFRSRSEERLEQNQEKEREKKKEGPRIERQRERGRDGMGY